VKKFLSGTVSKGLLAAVVAVLVIFIGAGTYYYWHETSGYKTRISELEQSLAETNNKLKITENEKIGLSNDLETERNKVGYLVDKVQDVAGVVGDLEKLSKTDPELLEKYSKVYFLNENYVPQRLSYIDGKYLYGNPNQQIHSDVLPHLTNLIDDAKDDGVNLKVVSAYRSFGEQETLKYGYTVTYGSGANQFSADQGYSEHQLGTTVDFTTDEVGGAFNSFANTDAYKWLLDHAYQYGFILSYPEGNTYYQFEPWHWRFVGTELARYLHREGINFYYMDQRKIDEYLINIFD
jgi:LAS superfamily LD-carboxypeptidase LdcB